MKRFLFICFSVLLSQYIGAYDFEYEGLRYNITTEEGSDFLTAETTYSGDRSTTATTYTGEIVIPTTVEYDNKTYTVTAIGEYTFYGGSVVSSPNTTITSIQIPESVTTIGQYAFYELSVLSAIDIPEGVTSIGQYAFRRCSALTSVKIPEGITEISQFLFDSCSLLAEINIPANVTSMGTAALSGCTKLESITLPDGLITIGDDCFCESGLVSIEIPNTVTSLGVAFMNCASLETVIIGSGVTSLDQQTFYHNYALQSITLLGDVTSIGSSCFRSCTSLEEIVLPASLTSIGSNAFNGCTALNTIYSYATVPPSAGSSAFNNVPSSCIVYVPEESVEGYQSASRWSALNIVAMPEPLVEGDTFETDGLYYKVISSEDMTVELTWGGTSSTAGTSTYTGEMVIPSTTKYYADKYDVIAIGENALNNCTGLTSIEFTDGITSIGMYALENCSNLEKVVMGNGVTTIEQEAFCWCSKLSDVTFGENVSIIGKWSFYQDYALESITFPKSLTEIVWAAFYQCTGLKTVEIPENVQIEEYAFQGCSALTSVKIGDGCSIGIYAFSYCSALTEINIPASVTELPEGLFGYSGLTSFNIPETITTIGPYVFYYCQSLADVNISKGVTSIGNYAFYYCSALTEVSIPASVTSVGNQAFRYCSKLTTLKLEDGEDDIYFTTSSSSSSNPFYNCNAFTDLYLGRPITYSTTNYSPFRGLTKLKNVTLGELITSICDYCFYGCDAIAKIEFPANVKTIGQYAFRDCEGLANLTIPSTITSMGIHAFDGCCFEEVTIEEGGLTNLASCVFETCTYLRKVTIPSTIESIDNMAFYNCQKLAEFYSLNPEPPTCGDNVFGSVPEDCLLYVPDGSYEAYSTADTWERFFGHMVEMTEFSLATLDASDVTDSSATLNGTVIAAYDEPVTERGFEYWTDENDVKTIVVETSTNGEISAVITDLPYGTEYTYRVYAITESEGTSYGEDITFTTEIYAPIVETLEAVEVGDVYAVLLGYITLGSEEINEVGFEYWADGDSEVQTLEASGTVIAVMARGLNPQTEYTYRAYAKTDTYEIVYGEEQTFTTTVATGINKVSADGINSENVEGYYSVGGQKLNEPQHGVNIVRFKDGSVKKIYVK